MNSKMIVIEGADGVGKATQSSLLLTNLRLHFLKTNSRKAVIKVNFPNYESDSSYFVKKFLSGNFPKGYLMNEVYAVSTSYALDRYLTWNSPVPSEIWEEFSSFYQIDPQINVSYRDLYKFHEHYGFSGLIVIADRYMQSNWMYQTARMLQDREKWPTINNDYQSMIDEFIKWSIELEILKFGLPGTLNGVRTFYLSLSEEIAKRNRMKRYQNNQGAEDILEKDETLQKIVRYIGDYLCDKKYMEKIICYDNSLMYSETEIQEKLLKRVLFIINPSEE